MVEKSFRLLLIEDNPGDIRLCRELLREDPDVDWDLDEARTLNEGLEKLTEGDYDLIGLDLSLPDSEGLGDIPRFKQITKELPVVILTGRDDRRGALTAVQEGAQDYLKKEDLTPELISRSFQYAIERFQLNKALFKLSHSDDLTGLLNRRGFFTMAEQQLKLVRRSREALTLFFVDIDRLKAINDHYGHQLGDRAIQAAGRVLRETFRESDLVARMGGDEFAVLAIGAPSDQRGVIYQRLQARLKYITADLELPFTLSLSVGTASWRPDQTKNLDRLLQQADQNMYAHKKEKTTIEVEATSPVQPVKEKPAFVSGNLELLLVEDNPGDARLVEEYLRDTEREIRITHVETLAGIRALETKDHFSVVLLDLSLPDSHGISTVEDVRALFPDLPLVVFTGRDDNEAAVRALQAGAQDYLVKGTFDGDLLERALHYAVERHQLLQQNRSYLREITRSEQILQSIFDHAEIGIFRTNKRGELTFANQALLEMTGHSSFSEARGERFFRDHFQVEEKFISDLIAGRKEISGELMDMVTVAEGAVPVRVGITRTTFDGQSILQGTVENVEEAVKSERMIHMQASALDAAANAIMITDREGTILWCNSAFTDLTGYSREEAVGGKPTMLKSGEQDKEFYAQLWKTIQSGRVWQGELINRRKTGGFFTERMTITPLENEHGEVYRFIAIMEDITNLKRNREVLQRRLEEVTLLKDLASAGMQARDENELFREVTALVGGNFYPDHFGIILVKEGGKSLQIHESYHGLPEEMLGTGFSIEKGATGRVARTEEPALIPDVRKDEDYFPAREEILSLLCVPLLVGHEVVGLINAESKQLNNFSEDDLRFLTTIANQVSTAISNLRNQQRERRQRQIAESLAEIALALNSSLELTQVLDQVLDQIADFVPYDAASLVLNRDGKGEVIQHRGYRERGLEDWIESIQIDLENPRYQIYEKMFKQEKPVLIQDTREDQGWVEIPEISWVRSYLGVPIRKDGNVIGMINLDHSQPGAFQDDFLNALVTLGNQIATAVENSRLYRQQKDQVDFLESLRQIDFAITGSMDLQVTLDVIMMEVMNRLEVDAINILLYDDQSYQLDMEAWRGFTYPDAFPRSFHLGEGLTGAVVKTRRPVLVQDLEEGERDVLRGELLSREGLRGYFGLPLVAKGKIVGVLELFRCKPFDPGAQWKHYAETVATQTAIAVDNAQLFDSLQGANRELSLAYDNTLEGWASALELRDQETEGHSRRVVDLTMRLVKELGIPKREWIHIRRGALLHDIGKMGVPDTILQKPGKLTEEEWKVMRQHPLLSKGLLESIDYLQPALDIPLYHHERWDGSGYPYGLKGEEIPLAARIFAVIDVWDALLSDRPYRDAWPEEKVLDHIRDQAGSHFDPQVIEQFLELVTGDDAVYHVQQGRVQS